MQRYLSLSSAEYQRSVLADSGKAYLFKPAKFRGNSQISYDAAF